MNQPTKQFCSETGEWGEAAVLAGETFFCCFVEEFHFLSYSANQLLKNVLLLGR